MSGKKDTIKSFTDLIVWRQAQILAVLLYKHTRDFPPEERYGIRDQIRRSAVSVTSNIAEGFSRKSQREKLQFYYTALGSLTELQNLLLISRDVGYLSREQFVDFADDIISVHKLLNAFISATKRFEPKD